MLRIILLLMTIASVNAAALLPKPAPCPSAELAAYLAEGAEGILHHGAPELCAAEIAASPDISAARRTYREELDDLRGAFSPNPGHLLDTLSLFGWEKAFDRYFRGRIQRFVQAIQTKDVPILRALLTETPEWACEPLWVSNAAGHAVMYVYPLILAVGVGSLRVVRLLLSLGASPHHQAAHLTGDTETDVTYGHSAFTLAAHNHDSNILELFGVPMPTPPTLASVPEEEAKGGPRPAALLAATALARAVSSGTMPSTVAPVPASVTAASRRPTASPRGIRALEKELPPAGDAGIHGKPVMEIFYDPRTFTFKSRPVASPSRHGYSAGGAGSSDRTGSPVKRSTH